MSTVVLVIVMIAVGVLMGWMNDVAMQQRYRRNHPVRATHTGPPSPPPSGPGAASQPQRWCPA